MARWVKSYDVADLDGQQLESKMHDLVENDWHPDTTHDFKVGRKQGFTIEPNPTPAQPGNGLVKFRGEAPNWDQLERSMNKNFDRRYKNFNEKPLKETFNPRTKADQANVLSRFETARRTRQDGPSFPTRSEVHQHTSAAVEQGRPREMIDAFRGHPHDRRWACNQRESGSSSYWNEESGNW